MNNTPLNYSHLRTVYGECNIIAVFYPRNRAYFMDAILAANIMASIDHLYHWLYSGDQGVLAGTYFL